VKYCADCGAGHECDAQDSDRTSDAVRIAELETRRDIEIARLQARADRAQAEADQEIAETFADAEVEAAAVEAEVVGAAIEAAGIEEAAPVVVDVAPPPPADDAADAEELPPAEGSPAPEAERKRSIGLGAW
jgi:hypothetical protein